MQTFFSVVIPLYNKAESIISTLDSILGQSFRDFEILIVDDGSTDNSCQVVEQYIDSRQPEQSIRLIRKKNGGVASARNRGIMESSGKYIALIDADDLWLEHYLSTQAELIKDFPNKALYYTCYSAIRDNCIEERTGDYYKQFRGELSNPWSFPIKPWTSVVVFTKNDAVTVGMFDEQLLRSQDLDMWWRLILLRGAAIDTQDCAVYRLAAENRISQIPVPLSNYICSKIPYYKKYRESDFDFRKFFDNQMADRLGFYLRRPRYHFQARKLARQLDMSVLPKEKRIRLRFPIYFQLLSMFKRFINNEPLLLRNANVASQA